jgi:DNA-binding NarL/FixJ family response regulator
VLASFNSAVAAVQCAGSIADSLGRHGPPGQAGLRIGISAGEPLTNHGALYGAAVELARALAARAQPGTILVSNAVQEICTGKELSFETGRSLTLPGFEEPQRVFPLRPPAPGAPVTPGPGDPGHTAALTARELEVLRLIVQGLSNRDIADRLVLSVRTVERHIANLYAKVGARTKAQATAYALRHSLF